MNTPRFSGAVGKDNTDRLVKRDYQTPAYAASIAITTKVLAQRTLVKVAQLTGALSLTIGVGTSTTDPMIGDVVEFLFNADATNRIVTFSTGFSSAGTLTVVASKKGYANFMFDGAAWQEMGRALTA